MTAPVTASGEGTLGIICGGGALPIAVADAVARRGRPIMLFALRGWADPQALIRYPHHVIELGQYGRLRRLALEAGCREFVMIGTVLRPALRQIRLDWATVRRLPGIVAMLRGGDNHLLSTLGRMFEDDGFRLLGAQDVAPEILMPEGPIGRRAPNERDRADIARGLALIAAMGPFDVGQAVVVAANRVLAVEAAEGTDHLLDRIAVLRGEGRVRTAIGSGVLIKAPKPGQDLRLDLPSIGPQTVAKASRAGLAGIAVTAGAAVIAQAQEVAEAADQAGLFVFGTAAEGRGA
jgi:DUF1009 family protein